jgi:AraC-type DNA-binding domain-containing proteins
MQFVKTQLNDVITVRKLVSLHYFEYANDFVFEGEKHDFWEFLYVDKGEVEVMADTEGYKLKQGDIIFHKPDEFHSVWANKKIAPNLVVVAFECKSPAMVNFEKKIFNLDDQDRNLLAGIISEGFKTFQPPLDMHWVNTLKKKPDAPFASEQLIRIYFETLLIHLVRKGLPLKSEVRLSTTARERTEEDVIKRIINYMQDNLSENLTIDAICRFSSMGRTHLKNIFKEKTGMSVVEYFKSQKIDYAKKLIREGEYNITEISENLGYSTIHSFSRHFKNVSGMSPSEYAKTIKARV